MPKVLSVSALSDHMKAPGMNLLSSVKEMDSPPELSAVDETETPPCEAEALPAFTVGEEEEEGSSFRWVYPVTISPVLGMSHIWKAAVKQYRRCEETPEQCHAVNVVLWSTLLSGGSTFLCVAFP